MYCIIRRLRTNMMFYTVQTIVKISVDKHSKGWNWILNGPITGTPFLTRINFNASMDK